MASQDIYEDLHGSTLKNQFLVPKFQIGSVHGKTQYSIEERVFHHDDVPQRAVKLICKSIQLLLLYSPQ